MENITWIIAGVLVLLLVWVISLYNRLVRARNYMQEGWSGIDVLLKKRYDLLPNLVETVKGYAAHESKLLQEVTALRTRAMQTGSVEEKQVAEQAVTRAIGSLFAVAENYPDLKASANFQQLQADIAGVETELERARRYYNATVRDNNVLVEAFPSNIIANSAGFKKGVFFEIDNVAHRDAPRVSF
ncbi:LemA protein [Filimonas lacunae]|uniref:LemA protein n=1 Tax=Filimonas lacunae TaxID=477680 RepID=A0A173MBR9_9BACT|nr:LemA family protein [Filimonas lacunae]BAV04960.1 LemA family protein [Filimonas lacunae]SIT33724.1 LemA protein [Filimonas lacunae]